MGYELRRQLREALGPDITGLQRAVALEIADDANERTRVSMAPLDDLVRWTGAKDGSVVRNALKRLAAAGWEFRIPIGKGKDGRVLYAVPGTRMTFKVPPFEGVATAPPSGSQGEQGLTQGVATAHSEQAGATPSNPQGGAGAHSEGATAHSEGAGATPYSSAPQTPHEEDEASSTQGGAEATPSGARVSARVITAEDKVEFGRFWALFPKSQDYDDTLEAWTAEVLDNGATPTEITAAAVAYAREKSGEQWRFIKSSRNWLTARRYLDKHPPEPNGKPDLHAVGGAQRPSGIRGPVLTADEINRLTIEDVL